MPTVMVVEDHPGLRELLVSVLRSDGYDVLEAASGDTALLAVEQASFSLGLLIIDLVLPGMSGAELLMRLRQSDPDLRALLISGNPATAVAPEAEYLQKPFAVEEFRARVRALMAGAQDPELAIPALSPAADARQPPDRGGSG